MEKIINIFKVLSDKTRLRILFILQQARKELCICELVDILDLPQYSVSRQIKELKSAQLVAERRDGKFVFYKAVKPDGKAQAQVCAAVMAFDRAFFVTDLENLKKRLKLRVKGKCVVGNKKRCC